MPGLAVSKPAKTELQWGAGNHLPFSAPSLEVKEMLLYDTRGQGMVEYIIVIAIIALIVGGAILTLTEGIGDKLLEFNDAL